MQLNALNTAVQECIDVATELGYVIALLSNSHDVENTEGLLVRYHNTIISVDLTVLGKLYI